MPTATPEAPSSHAVKSTTEPGPEMAHRRSAPRRSRQFAAASWLVLGGPKASAIQFNGLQAVVLLARTGTKSGDHPKRYRPGQRLAVKPYVPGPTECHVLLTDVQGKGSTVPFMLGHIDYHVARELGYVRLDTFQEAWVREYDTLWCEKVLPTAGVCEQDAILERFKDKWASKLAWLLRFKVDITAEPRLMAVAGGSVSFRSGPDRRWVHVPRDTDTEEDRGYTSVESRSVKGDLPALTDAEWETHVGHKSRYREQDRLAERRREREAKALPARLDAAKAAARAKGADIHDEVRRYERLVEQGDEEKALRQLERIEGRVFPVAA